MFLPAKVAFTARGGEADWEFDLADARSGKPHLSGSARPA
jgi:hypothetical protein